MPDVYARAQWHTVPESECGYIKQIPAAHVTYVNVYH